MKRKRILSFPVRLPWTWVLLASIFLLPPSCKTGRGRGVSPLPSRPFPQALAPGEPLSLGPPRVVPLVLPKGEVRAADADGDGRWDLFLEDRILLQGGDGIFRETRDLPWPRPEAFLLCDWDGDGRTDVLSARPLLHWWKGGAKALFPLEDQGALLTKDGKTLRISPPWDRMAAVLDADGDGRPDLVLGGPEGLGLYLQADQGRIRPAGLLRGPKGRPFRTFRPTSLAGFPGPGGRPMLALFDGFPAELRVYAVKKEKSGFRLEERTFLRGPFPGVDSRAGGPGPLAAVESVSGKTLLLAGPVPALLETDPAGLRLVRSGLKEKTRDLRLPGQAYPLLAMGPGGRRFFLAGPGCFFFSGIPPAASPGPPLFPPRPGIPIGPCDGGVLLLKPGPKGEAALVTWKGKDAPPPILPPLLPLSRPALGDLDGDGVADLAGFPGGGGFLTFWKGKKEGGFGSPLVLPVSPLVKAVLPTVLSARGPGLALSSLPGREDFFAQVELKRPGPGPWGGGLLLRFRNEKNMLLLEAGLSAGDPASSYRVSLVEILEGEKRILVERKVGFPDGDWHTLAASLVGRRVRAWWDGGYLDQGRTALSGPAETGLCAGRGRIHFRRFRILPPPGSIPSGKELTWKDTLLGKRKVLGGSWHLVRDLPEPEGGILFSRPGPGRPGPALFAVDWDRDGDLDLLVGRVGFPLMWLEQKSPLEFKPPRAIRLLSGKPLHRGPLLDAPAAADLDGDGRPDILLGDGLGRVLWYPGRVIAFPPLPPETP